MPNNREWAILIWFGVVLLVVLHRKGGRSSIGSIFRTARHPKILIPFACMLAYVALLAWLGSVVGLWRAGLIKDTIVWFLVSGIALFFKSTDAANLPHFFRNRIAAAFAITAFIEFFVNLFVLPLWAEFILQPFLAVLAMLSVYAGHSNQYPTAKRIADVALALIGLALLAFALGTLITNWSKTDKGGVLLQMALPIWMTIGLLPFVYLLSLYVTYEKAFGGVDFATEDRRERRRAKLAILTKLHFRHREVNAFPWNWAHRTAAAPGFAAARETVTDFLDSRRKAKKTAAEEQERLRRYAGSDATDSDGRRLDRREFKETTRAFDWLASCQMGWYRNHGKRYRADLLEKFGNDFTRQGLPAEPGMTMRVSKNGQSWYAWRRTVSGWCFAVGAAGPPPDQWQYDGPEPPQGFPGKDKSWGDGPASTEAGRNWKL